MESRPRELTEVVLLLELADVYDGRGGCGWGWLSGALLNERDVRLEELDESLSEDSLRRCCALGVCELPDIDGMGEKAPGRR